MLFRIKSPVKRCLVLFLSLLPALLLSYFNIFNICVPIDEGLLGESALRFSRGEVPHVDFEDPYTGLLNIFHSTAFKLFSQQLTSIRIFHFLVFSAFLFMFAFYLFFLTRSLILSILSSWAYVLWSYLHYPAAMPSWYVGYFVFLAMVFLHRWKLNDKTSNLLLAAMFIAIATLIKINSVIFLLAGLWVLFLHHSSSVGQNNRESLPSKTIKSALLILSVIFFLFILKSRINPLNFIYFLLPCVLICGKLTFSNKLNVKEFISSAIIFVLTYLAVQLIWVLPYLLGGTLNDLLNGLFILPLSRMHSASNPPPGLLGLGALFFLGFIFSNLLRKLNEKKQKEFYLVLGAAIILFNFVYLSEGLEKLVALFFGYLPLLLILFLLRQQVPHKENSLLFSWLIFSAFGTWVQYPYYGKAYLDYVMNIHLVTFLLFMKTNFKTEKTLLSSLVFFVMIVNGVYQNVRIDNFTQANLFAPLVGKERVVCLYQELISFISENSLEGSEILAFPDSPEVYFCGKRKNPSKWMYEFFSQNDVHYPEYMKLIKEKKVSLVVINTEPCCSPRVSAKSLETIKTFYPEELKIGQYLIFYDKEEARANN